MLILELPAGAIATTVAATNKCLAKSNKSRTGDKAIVRIEARAVPYDIGRKAYRVLEKMVS